MHFGVRVQPGVPRLLVGTGGYKGPPADGTFEIGYAIVSDQRRRGYATELSRLMLARAFAVPGVRRAIAETLPELVGSIGVLENCGFRRIGAGSEPGVIRFELLREEFKGD
jgi:RimJ/RimL family protein N-acetyltransferase